ncbi:MAG: histidine kinase dimerization/phospho-acceptor domain-containing protein, partial [Planctomycetota bacterium]
MIAPRFSNMNIKQKLAAIVMLPTSIALLLIAAIFIAWGQFDSRNNLAEDLHSLAGVMAEDCKAALAFSDKADAERLLAALRFKESIVYACLYDSKKLVFAEYQRGDIAKEIPAPLPQDNGHVFENGQLSVFRRVDLDGQAIGTVHLRDCMSGARSDIMWDVAVAILILPLALAITYLLSSKLQQAVSGPIRHLAEVAEQVSEHKDYSARALKTTDDEVGLLIEAFNEMLRRIQRRDSDLVKYNEQLLIFNRFAENSGQGFGMADLKGHLTYTNSALRHILDEQTPEQTIGKSIFDYYLQQDVPRLRDQILPAVMKYGQQIVAMPLLSTTGKVTPTLQSIFLIHDDKGKPLCLANVITDITDQKRIENELQKHREHLEELVRERTAELENINRQLEVSVERADLLAREAMAAAQAKSQFLANMSHEIRTPMNAIIGFGDLLAEDKLNDQQKQHLNLIRESSRDLLEIINDILDFSKIEAGKLETELVDCSLAKLLNSVESLMRPKAREKGLEFGVVEGRGLPAIIRTNPVRLRQCLLNLLSNAIKFTEHGHVRTTVSLVQRADEPNVRFDVE